MGKIDNYYNRIDEMTSKHFNFSLSDIPIPETELFPLDDIKVGDGLLIGSKEALKSPYLVQGGINSFLISEIDEYFITGFWGHGINSHAFYYSRIDNLSKIFFRLPFGGVYMNNEEE